MAARSDPLAAKRAPIQPPASAVPRGNTLPELDRRLLMQRTAVAESVERLRGRMRQDLRNLSPLEQAQRHPEAALAMAGVVSVLAGRLVGRWAVLLFR